MAIIEKEIVRHNEKIEHFNIVVHNLSNIVNETIYYFNLSNFVFKQTNHYLR